MCKEFGSLEFWFWYTSLRVFRIVCIVPVFVCVQQSYLKLLGKLPHWTKLNYWQSLTKNAVTLLVTKSGNKINIDIFLQRILKVTVFCYFSYSNKTNSRYKPINFHSSCLDTNDELFHLPEFWAVHLCVSRELCCTQVRAFPLLNTNMLQVVVWPLQKHPGPYLFL